MQMIAIIQRALSLLSVLWVRREDCREHCPPWRQPSDAYNKIFLVILRKSIYIQKNHEEQLIFHTKSVRASTHNQMCSLRPQVKTGPP